MIIIPAIDIKDGCVVRYVQGKLDKKIYSRDPLKTARHWVKQGAKLIHVIDLDGAFTGSPKNLGIAKQIAQEVDVPVQFGGGVRTIETIKQLCDLGVYRVVLGTRAVQDNEFLKQAFKGFKEKVIVSVDTRGEDIVIKGWQEALELMKTGSKWQIFIPPDLAYGQRQFNRIPPSSVLVFEIELLAAGDGSAPKATGRSIPTGNQPQ